MRQRKAFTLVELLVVIGIIALLISILLPSLSRARGAANAVDCQARLRQIGMGMQLYATSNNGVFPWGMLYHDAAHLTGTPNPYPNERWWKWHYTVSQMLGTDNMQNNNAYWGPNNPIFIDKDSNGEETPWGWRSDYIAHPRIMPQNSTTDPFPPSRTSDKLSQTKMASIRNSAEVMAVWDSPQNVGYGNSAQEIAEFPHSWQFYWGTYLTMPNPQPSQTWISALYDTYIMPGEQSSGDGRVLQKQWNKDFPGAPWDDRANGGYQSAFRFRHMGNTTLNALYADGHVDSKKVGEIKIKDVSVKIGAGN